MLKVASYTISSETMQPDIQQPNVFISVNIDSFCKVRTRRQGILHYNGNYNIENCLHLI